MRAVTAANAAALSLTQAMRLAGQSSGAPNRSLMVWATRSSGINCWTLR